MGKSAAEDLVIILGADACVLRAGAVTCGSELSLV